MYPFTILHEERQFLVVNKPAGLLTQGDASGDPDLFKLLREWLKEKTGSANPYLALVHRLDRPVSGAVIFARTTKSAARFSRAFREHRVEKHYLAWVSPSPSQPEGVLEDLLYREKSLARTVALPLSSSRTSAAVPGKLKYRTLSCEGKRSLLLIEPLTGRKHQIRAQMAAIGSPIVGDKRYGSRLPAPQGTILLHAVRLSFSHPIQGTKVSFIAPLPPYFPCPVPLTMIFPQELL